VWLPHVIYSYLAVLLSRGGCSLVGPVLQLADQRWEAGAVKCAAFGGLNWTSKGWESSEPLGSLSCSLERQKPWNFNLPPWKSL